MVRAVPFGAQKPKPGLHLPVKIPHLRGELRFVDMQLETIKLVVNPTIAIGEALQVAKGLNWGQQRDDAGPAQYEEQAISDATAWESWLKLKTKEEGSPF